MTRVIFLAVVLFCGCYDVSTPHAEQDATAPECYPGEVMECSCGTTAGCRADGTWMPECDYCPVCGDNLRQYGEVCDDDETWFVVPVCYTGQPHCSADCTLECR